MPLLDDEDRKLNKWMKDTVNEMHRRKHEEQMHDQDFLDHHLFLKQKFVKIEQVYCPICKNDITEQVKIEMNKPHVGSVKWWSLQNLVQCCSNCQDHA